jgi:hypothetical protein
VTAADSALHLTNSALCCSGTILPTKRTHPPPLACTQVVAPLGPTSVALAASSQLTPQRLLVDEYYRSGGGYVLAQPAAELATYLHSR